MPGGCVGGRGGKGGGGGAGLFIFNPYAAKRQAKEQAGEASCVPDWVREGGRVLLGGGQSASRTVGVGVGGGRGWGAQATEQVGEASCIPDWVRRGDCKGGGGYWRGTGDWVRRGEASVLDFAKGLGQGSTRVWARCRADKLRRAGWAQEEQAVVLGTRQGLGVGAWSRRMGNG